MGKESFMDKVKKIKKDRVNAILTMFFSVLFGIGFAGGVTSIRDTQVSDDPLIGAYSIGFLIAVIAFFVGLISFFINNDKLKKFCLSCGASMNGAAYDIQETSRTSNSHGDVTAHVSFSADCPSCGVEKKFSKSYQVYFAGRYNSSTGQMTSQPHHTNIDNTLKNEAKKYFGH